MTKASDNVFPRFLISEGGSTSTPASGNVTVYAKANGLLYSKDDAGAETALGAAAAAPAFVGAKAYNNAVQSIGTGGAKLIFNTEDFDTNTFHDTVTDNSRFTVPSGKAGYYLVTVFIYVTASVAYDAVILVNNTTQYTDQRGAAAAGAGRTFSDIVLLAVGDYVECNVVSDSTTNYGHASARQAQNQMSVALLGT